MAVFAIRDLSFTYPECSQPAICQLSLTVEKGEFLVICGPSGCGKSTLLRQLKTVLAPHGVKTGEIRFHGQMLETVQTAVQAAKIGFVSQSPEDQIVTDKVWHELAFGLESLGLETPVIRGRVAEMAAFFGIENWFYKNVTELSGGQKQLLNLASVMVMRPEVLILDEPTSQLDPIAASEFLATLGKINRELGTTVILTEHRLEEALALAERVAVMENGALACIGTAQEVGVFLRNCDSQMLPSMPTPVRIWASVPTDESCPVTVTQGRKWLEKQAMKTPLLPLPPEDVHPCTDETVIAGDALWFRYEKNSPDIIRGLSLRVHRGEFLAILGGNGAGKTTMLKLLTGLEKPYRGTLQIDGKVTALPQDPKTLFVKKTVAEDLAEALPGRKDPEKLRHVTALCHLEKLLDRHPYDLSGGEQQRAALAKLLLTEPEILLLDEPTKGFDGAFKEEFASILQVLNGRGVTVLMVSHDVEFCAEYAHRCGLFFDGSIVTQGTPRTFFSGNSFYTTATGRMAGELLPGAITPEDVIVSCGGAVEKKTVTLPEIPAAVHKMVETQQKKLPLWRKLLAGVSGIVALAIFFHATGTADLSSLVTAGGVTVMGRQQMMLYGALIAALLICGLSVYRRCAPSDCVQMPGEKRKLARRTVIASVIILLSVPFTLYMGVFYLGSRQYYVLAFAVLLQCMIPFFLIFEGRKPQVRELVVIASLCALGVAGRAAFFMLPQFKPVAAMTVIAGIAFGGESGFLVGAVTMLVSNILFSQGPWTPFQMFAMGMIGFFAGVLFRKGLLRRTRLSMCIYGALAVLVIYGGIMNPASALIWGSETLNWQILMSYYITGFPMDLIHSAATVIFLWFGGEPLLEKLDRIKVKYGLIT